jgi:hypothetical protein
VPCLMGPATAKDACSSLVWCDALCPFTGSSGDPWLLPCALLQVAAVYGYELHLSLDGAACGPVPTPSTVQLRPLSGDLTAEAPKQQQRQTQQQPQKQGVKRPLQVGEVGGGTHLVLAVFKDCSMHAPPALALWSMNTAASLCNCSGVCCAHLV